MPHGLRGPALADQLLVQQSDLKVLFLSGYTDHGLDGRVGPGSFLEKPFTLKQLLKEVQRVMEQ